MQHVWKECSAAHIARGLPGHPLVGGPVLLVKRKYKVYVFPVNADVLAVDVAKCVAGMGRGEHRARTFWGTVSGTSGLTFQKQYKVDVFLSTSTVPYSKT